MSSSASTVDVLTAPNRKSQWVNSFAFKYLLSSVSAASAETVTFPMDITKCRLQVQGESVGAGQQQAKGAARIFTGIIRDEGFRGLYGGLSPAVFRHVIYSGARVQIYSVLRDLLGRDADGTFPVHKAMAAGIGAGALGQMIACPTDNVKVKMQVEGGRRVMGLPPRYTGAVDCCRKIVASNGVRGLWRGVGPASTRAALVNLGDLSTYDLAKQALLKRTHLEDNTYTHMLASLCSGFVAALVSTPADVVKTRLMAEGANYSNSWHCLSQTVHREGLLALYKGFIPIYCRLAPWSMTFWLVNERLRMAAGLDSF